MAAGLDSPTSGTIVIGERPVSGQHDVFQGESIFPWMTVFDNAAYGLRMHRNAPRPGDLVGSYLARMGLARAAGAPHLSGGMKARSIARVATDPGLLLMDETPFGAGRAELKTLLPKSAADLGRGQEGIHPRRRR